MPPHYNCGHWTATKRSRSLSRHRNAGLELVLVLNGAVTWDYEGHSVTVPPRHLSFTWPWQWHSARGGSLLSSEICWVILPFRSTPTRPDQSMRFDESLGLRQSEHLPLLDALLKLPQPVIKASRITCQLLPEAVTCLVKANHRPDFRSRALLVAVLAEILEQVRTVPVVSGRPASGKVAEFLAALDKCCAEEWTLEAMAEACGLGRTHFSRCVKEQTGETPMQFLNRKRMERAGHLLASASKSVTEIAFQCGFGSSQYFATVFRQFHDCTPMEFRARSPLVHPAYAHGS